MKKWLKIVFWVIFISGVIVLQAYALKHQKNHAINLPKIDLEIQDGIVLINKEEIMNLLRTNGFIHDSLKKSELEINAIEKFLGELNEIESVDVYKRLNDSWFIQAKIKRPIARIKFNDGDGFYVDKHGNIMNLSPFSKPRILAFTGLDGLIKRPIESKKIINNDSLITKYKLGEIYRISSYVCNDAFYDAQIVQVHYDESQGFILIPRVGGQKIIFGTAESDEEVRNKFEKLTTFYEEVIPYEGWDKYSVINLRFANQIVAREKDN